MIRQGTSRIKLIEADEVIIKSVTDNYADRLEPGSDFVVRFPLSDEGRLRVGPVAEHGFSATIQVKRGNDTHLILFDTGVTEAAITHNMTVLEVPPDRIEGIVISHGHIDHGGGLPAVLSRIKTRKIPVVLHPLALRKRWLIKPDGEKTDISMMDETRLCERGASVIKSVDPYLMAGGLIATTGQINRQVEFEKGFPFGYAEIDGKIEEDFDTIDDQAVVMNVRGKGLVIISGCGHAGIVNTALYCREITGVDDVFAIMGGFHLTGDFYEPVIDKTVEAIRVLKPQHVIPCHCTGWKAIHRFAEKMPTAFIQNAVGTTYIFH